MVKSPSPDNGPQHGIAAAYYSGGPGEPYFQAVMECCCGWTSARRQSWAEAGEELDQHLASIKTAGQT